MALADNVFLRYNTDAQPVAPSAILSPWATVIAAGGPANQDAASITNPDTQITAATTSIIQREAIGTLLALSLGYDDALTSITDPIVKVFGRYDENRRWELVPNLAGDLAKALATAATDVADGTLKYTTVNAENHVWNVGAFNQLLVGVETALAGTGSTSNSIIQARLWG